MRPIKLEMTAFCSYKEHTIIPFDRLSGLYLITGDTGAGKTTIFDAIMFALFGESSGRDRKKETLHCDFADLSEDTIVKLCFEQDGKKYTVTRSLHYTKRRETGAYELGTPNAELVCEHQAPVKNTDAVTKKCEEIIGLNAEQFRSIVMLAQGEFKKFLEADSKNKAEILQKLFDTSKYSYYQELLKRTRDKLEDKRKQQAAKLKQYVDMISKPDVMSDEEKEALSVPDHPAMLTTLRALIEKEEKEKVTIDAQCKALYEKIGDLNTQKGTAEGVNADINELEKKRKAIAGLEQQDAEIAERKTRLERVEAAFRKGKPAINTASGIQEKLLGLDTELKQIDSDLREAIANEENARELVGSDEETKSEIQEIKTGIEKIDVEIPRIKELQEKKNKLSDLNYDLEKLAEDISTKQKKEELISEELAALDTKLEELSNIDTEVIQCKTDKDKTLKSLDKLKEIQSKVSNVAELEEHLADLKSVLFDLTAAAGKYTDEYTAIYHRFLDGQARLIAKDLKEELLIKETVDCPVCGTHLHSDDIPHFAQSSVDDHSREDVDAAREKMDKADKAMTDQKTLVKETEAQIKADKKNTVESVSNELTDCDTWEKLIEDGYLEGKIIEAESADSDAERSLANAQERQDLRNDLKDQHKGKEEEQKKIKESIEELNNRSHNLKEQISTLNGEISSLEKQNTYDTVEDAESKRTELEARKNVLERVVNEHQNNAESAAKVRAELEGRQKQTNETRKQCDDELIKAINERNEIIAEQGFSSVDDVVILLEVMGDEDGDTWIKTEQNALDSYFNDKAKLSERIAELEKKTEGKELTDIANLERQIKETNEEYGKKSTIYNNICAQYDHNSNIEENVTDIIDKMKGFEEPYQMIKRLADQAVGSNSVGGKVSFERYVMGAMFREILDSANIRIEMLSGGRYVLEHKVDAGDDRKQSGLDIWVLDNNTGRRRISGSLSGGESFFTSLALALGLSDVVQSHSGGKSMDALFIDEGFGTLSDQVLDRSLDVLTQLTEGNRLVGIISHVERLDESIPQKILVKCGDKGSSLVIESLR